MIVALGADHGGFELKAMIGAVLSAEGFDIMDLGAFDEDPSDYPDYSLGVGRAVVDGRADRGILVCGSGVGACVAANKIPGVRAATAHDTYSAHQGVEDDDVNVLCLGARVIGRELALEVTRAFLGARFSGAERHMRRVSKVLDIEARYCRGADGAQDEG